MSRWVNECMSKIVKTRTDLFYSFTHRLIYSFTNLLVLMCFSAQGALACPWCKDALFSPGESASQSGAAKGYALSIGLLLGLPVLMLSVIALAVIRSARRAKRLSVKD